jgi:mRNA interferase RelE/StbE
MYEVLLTESASLAYQRADVVLARKLNRCVIILSQTPRTHPNAKLLSGPLAGRWRYRLGDWRVTYRIDEEAKKVIVLRISHRREAYR